VELSVGERLSQHYIHGFSPRPHVPLSLSFFFFILSFYSTLASHTSHSCDDKSIRPCHVQQIRSSCVFFWGLFLCDFGRFRCPTRFVLIGWLAVPFLGDPTPQSAVEFLFFCWSSSGFLVELGGSWELGGWGVVWTVLVMAPTAPPIPPLLMLLFLSP